MLRRVNKTRKRVFISTSVSKTSLLNKGLRTMLAPSKCSPIQMISPLFPLNFRSDLEEHGFWANPQALRNLMGIFCIHPTLKFTSLASSTSKLTPCQHPSTARCKAKKSRYDSQMFMILQIYKPFKKWGRRGNSNSKIWCSRRRIRNWASSRRRMPKRLKVGPSPRLGIRLKLCHDKISKLSQVNSQPSRRVRWVR